MWWYGYSHADVVMGDLSFNLIVMVMMMMMMMMMVVMIMTDDDDDNGDNDDNDWQRRLWNVVMEHACMSNRKDFEQAYTVGHWKTSVIVVQYFSHQQKSHCGFEYSKHLDANRWKPNIYFLCNGKFFRLDLKHQCFPPITFISHGNSHAIE